MRVVTGQVKAGELVVVDGLQRVIPGVPVAPQVLKVDASGNIGGQLTQGAFKIGFGATQSISVATPLTFAIGGESFTLSSACGGACNFNGATTSMSMTLSGTCSGGVCANSSAATSNATGLLVGNQAGGLSVVGTVSSPAPTVTFAGAFKR
jgi:hypothetical protein